MKFLEAEKLKKSKLSVISYVLLIIFKFREHFKCFRQIIIYLIHHELVASKGLKLSLFPANIFETFNICRLII